LGDVFVSVASKPTSVSRYTTGRTGQLEDGFEKAGEYSAPASSWLCSWWRLTEGFVERGGGDKSFGGRQRRQHDIPKITMLELAWRKGGEGAKYGGEKEEKVSEIALNTKRQGDHEEETLQKKEN